MKSLFFSLIFFVFSLHFLSAQEFPGLLDPPSILKPIPSEYCNDKRLWQGIPGITVAPQGRLWAAWYSGGLREGTHDNYVLLVTSNDSGKTWTDPILAIDMPGPVRVVDPAFWTDPEGKVWFFWTQLVVGIESSAGTWYMTTDTPDQEDAVWSVPKRICDGLKSTKSIVDSKNRWIHPVVLKNDGHVYPGTIFEPGTHFVASEDKGKTFQSIGHVTVPRKDADHDETNIIEKKDGSFWALLRTNYGIAESFSTDSCKTWTEPKPSKILNTTSRFFVRRLKSGNLLFVKNGNMSERIGRTHLQAFLSDDDGKTWKGGLMLDDRQVSYPDGDQADDGTIFVIYDHERDDAREILLARFTEEDILNGKIVSDKSALRLLINKATGAKWLLTKKS